MSEFDQARLDPQSGTNPPFHRREGLAHKSTILDEAYREFFARRDAGDAVDPDAYCARFPEVKSSLGRILRAHLLLEENPEWLSPAIRWPEPGEMFAGFHLIRELGQGSFARVFLATDASVGNRPVALKVSIQGEAEASILGTIKHPNIVSVHSAQVEKTSGLTVVCMPYLGSATLCNLLDYAFARGTFPSKAQTILDVIESTSTPGDENPLDSPLPSPFLKRATYTDGIRMIAAQLANGLAFIHARGIWHRDLKPSNVLLARDGTPMLLDFNLSLDSRKLDAHVGGTLPYMSPEQLLATGEESADLSLLDFRSDIFSLGVILYELLTGTHPFGPLPLKFSTQDLRKHLAERHRKGAEPLRCLHPGIDKPFARLIEQCLAYNPMDRPKSAAEIESALRRQMAPFSRACRWMRRHPKRLVAMIVPAVTVCLFGIGAWYFQAPYSIRQFHQGVALYQGGQYRTALQRFSASLEENPKFSEALFFRARAYLKLGFKEKHYFNAAIADFRETDGHVPNGRNKACLGYCHNQLNQPQPAKTYYQLAIKAGFATREVFNNLGYTCLQIGELDDAEKNLNRALELDPNCSAALHNRARLWCQKALAIPLGGKTKTRYVENGFADICRAIELGPKSADLYRQAAHLCVLAAAEDSKWIVPSLEHLASAIDHGDDPKALQANYIFSLLKNEAQFKNLHNRPKTGHPFKMAERLLDPIRDISE